MKISGNAYSFQFQIFRRVLNSMPKKIKQKVTRGHNIAAIQEHRLNKVVERIVRRINAHKRTKKVDDLLLKKLKVHFERFSIPGKKDRDINGCHIDEYYDSIFCAIFRGRKPRFYIRPIILDAIVKKFDKLKKSIIHAEEPFGVQKSKIHISPEIRKSLIKVFDPLHKKCVNTNNGEPIDITKIVTKYMDNPPKDLKVLGHANGYDSVTITFYRGSKEFKVVNLKPLSTQTSGVYKYQCNSGEKTTCPTVVIEDVFSILNDKKEAVNIFSPRLESGQFSENGIFKYNDGKHEFFFFICNKTLYPEVISSIFERFPKFKSFIEQTLLLDKIPRLQ